MTSLSEMTQQKWDAMSQRERDLVRSDASLSPQLMGLEGWRVEVVTDYGERRRFIVGKSTGWIPCHLEISRRSAFGGMAAEKHYQFVQKLYKVR